MFFIILVIFFSSSLFAGDHRSANALGFDPVIETIPALRQNDAQCGYHALKNLIIMMDDQGINNFLIKDELKQRLLNNDFYNKTLGAWQDAIKKIGEERTEDEIKRFGKSEWLSGNEIELLKKSFYNSQEMPIFVIEPDRHNEFQLTDLQLRIVQIFLSKDSGKIGIVWNVGGEGRHWVAFVVVKNKENIHIYHIDSAGGSINEGDRATLVNLFSSTPEKIQEIINQVHQKGIINQMLDDLSRLEQSINVLEDKDMDNVYTVYKGCNNKKGIWINKKNEERGYDSGLDCQLMNQRYRKSWLVVDDKGDVFVFDPNSLLENMYRVCLITWKNYLIWPEEMQKKITRLLRYVFIIASQNDKTEMLKSLRENNFDIMDDLNSILEKLPKTEEQHSDIRALAAGLIID